MPVSVHVEARHNHHHLIRFREHWSNPTNHCVVTQTHLPFSLKILSMFSCWSMEWASQEHPLLSLKSPTLPPGADLITGMHLNEKKFRRIDITSSHGVLWREQENQKEHFEQISGWNQQSRWLVTEPVLRCTTGGNHGGIRLKMNSHFATASSTSSVNGPWSLEHGIVGSGLKPLAGISEQSSQNPSPPHWGNLHLLRARHCTSNCHIWWFFRSEMLLHCKEAKKAATRRSKGTTSGATLSTTSGCKEAKEQQASKKV